MPAMFSTVEQFFRPRIEESNKFFFRAEEKQFFQVLPWILNLIREFPQRQEKLLSERDLLY